MIECSIISPSHLHACLGVGLASQRAKDKEASLSAAQLQISAKKVDGAWTITELQPL